jgi:hypothetical protein
MVLVVSHTNNVTHRFFQLSMGYKIVSGGARPQTTESQLLLRVSNTLNVQQMLIAHIITGSAATLCTAT